MEGRVRSARRADTRPFSQILSDGTQEDHDRTFSVASPPRTSRKGRKGAGSGRARAYAEIPEYDNLPKPKQAMNQQHRERMARKRQLRDRSQASHGPSQGLPRATIAYAVNAVDLPQQQYPSDSGEETRTCWSFVVRLCRCCAKRLFRRGSTRQAEEDRLRELRLLEEERKVMELQRQFQEIRQRMDRRLEKAATKYEMKERKREEEKKEQQLLREQVQDKHDNEAAAAGQLSRGLTRQEMKKELKRLQKLERNLSVRLGRLEQRQDMSAPAPWTSSTDDDEVVEVMETPKHLLRTSKQKQMTTPREMERTAAMARKRESMSAPWTSSASGPVKDDNNSVELGQWELDRLHQHQLELQRQEMEHRLAVEKAVQLNRHKEDMREMERQWKLQDDAKKKKGSEQQLERQRKMAKRAEEELVSLIEQLQNSNVKQQKSDMKAKEYTQTTARQQKLCSQNIQREAEPWKVEHPDVVQPEPQRKANGESTTKQQLENTMLSAENKHPMEMQIWLKMQEQLQAMKHKFKMGGNMDAERFKKRWKRMDEEQQREWEKMVLELHRMLAEEKQQQVVWKPHKEQKNIAKEAPTRVDIQTKPEKKEIAIGKETGEERKLEKVENIRTEAFTQVEIPSKPEKKETIMMEETNEKDIIYESEQAEETSEEKPVMEKVQPTQGNQITTFTESEESLKHAQFPPEDTPPEIENKVSVKTGGEENRSNGENGQPKQTMCQKTCGIEWLTEYRQKREQERNGLQSEKTETNNTIMVRPTSRIMARQADADKGSKPDAKQVKSKGMDWLCEIKPEKDLLHAGCQARPVVAGRRQRACEPAAEKAQLEPVVHKDLEDMDWFGDMAVKNRENKRAEINRRHQQSRQESILMLQGLTNQPEKKKDENNKGMNVISRHATTRHADADEGWLLKEKTPRDTKQSIFSQRSHQKMDWLCESKTQQRMDSESVTTATMVPRRRRTQESATENTDTPKHKELSDDWLSNINKDDKRANNNMRHQQNRELSRHEPQKKQIDLEEQTAKDNIMVVAPNMKDPVNKKIDAEVNKQAMEWPNTREEWWSELRRNNQRKLMGNQRKQDVFGVHVSKPKEQARELEGQRITLGGILDNMSYTQLKKTEDTVVDEKTKVSEKAAAMTRRDNSKQSQMTGARQTTDRWFGEWMKTKKSDKKLDEVREEKDRTVLSETRCPPSREENRKRGDVETLVTNVLMVTEVQHSQVTAEKAQSNGRSGLLWDNLKGELLIQPCGSRTEASQQLDFGDIALSSTTKRKVVSPLQQTTTQQRASSIDIIQNKKFELDDDDGLESITLEEERKPEMWLTKAINTTATPQTTNTLVDANEKSGVLLNKPTDKQAKKKRQVELASHEKEQEKDGEAHKDEELRSVMKQGETREDKAEDEKAAYCSKSPSVVPLSCPSLDADSEKGSVEEKWQQITSAVFAEEQVQPAEEEKLLHEDTEDHLGTLEKSPSLVNLLACSSDASGGEEGDGRSETTSLAPYETADDVDKSVRRRVLKWMNNKAKDYYSKKIEKTFKREQEEGHELYAPWFSTNILMRSERELEKRKGLLKAEEMRQRLESSLLKWGGKRAQKRALRMEEAYSLDREPDDLWFCEDLL